MSYGPQYQHPAMSYRRGQTFRVYTRTDLWISRIPSSACNQFSKACRVSKSYLQCKSVFSIEQAACKLVNPSKFRLQGVHCGDRGSLEVISSIQKTFVNWKIEIQRFSRVGFARRFQQVKIAYLIGKQKRKDNGNCLNNFLFSQTLSRSVNFWTIFLRSLTILSTLFRFSIILILITCN